MIPLPTLNADASAIAGQPVVISCDAPSTFPPGVAGYTVVVNGVFLGVIHLPIPTCTRLEHLDTGNEIIPADVLVLEHEAQHIALASTDECLVERTALANEWGLLRLLKLPAWRARLVLAGAAYVDAHMPAPYHPDPTTGAC